MLWYYFEFYDIDIVGLIGLLDFVIHCDFFLILDNYSLTNLILYLSFYIFFLKGDPKSLKP